ncbi:MAG TPA: hypothetical protein VKY56_00970 [Chloroflexota bacterium]|nr:hypothetical protein [Chloroflexota bacterium]
MQIVIRYNAERGFEDAALALARHFFARFDAAIDSLTLAPTAAVDLELFLDGRPLYVTRAADRLPRASDIVAALPGRVEPPPAPPRS